MHSFIYLFIYSFVHSFIHSFIYSFIRSFIHSFIHLFIHSFVRSFIHSEDLYCTSRKTNLHVFRGVLNPTPAIKSSFRWVGEMEQWLHFALKSGTSCREELCVRFRMTHSPDA